MNKENIKAAIAEGMTQARKLDLEKLELESGAHNPDGKFCVMEAVAYVAGEPWSDSPKCACPVLGRFLRNWNDSLDNATRQKLKPYIPRIVGTNDGNSDRRGWMCLDWLTREFGPAFMELTPALHASAAVLRALPEITDGTSLGSAMATIRVAQKESDAAAAAAWAAAKAAAKDAAWAAAADAAWAAAWAAAADAAWAAAADAAAAAAWAAAADAAWAAAKAAAWAAAADAAWAAAADAAADAAWDAAKAAAWDAAKAAAWERLMPVTKQLHKSAFALLDRMLDLPRLQ